VLRCELRGTGAAANPRTTPHFDAGCSVAWNEQCAWCTVPLRSRSSDNQYTKSLSGKRSRVPALHSLAPTTTGRPPITSSLPAASECFQEARVKTPPRTPAISLLLQKASSEVRIPRPMLSCSFGEPGFSNLLTKVNAVLGSHEADQLTSSEPDALETQCHLTPPVLNERAQRPASRALDLPLPPRG